MGFERESKFIDRHFVNENENEKEKEKERKMFGQDF